MSPGPLWTAAAVIATTGGEGPAGWQAGGLSIDSRSLQAGDLFVAIEGPNFDGHDFIGAALEAGAVAAMAHRVPAGLAPDAPLVLVDDTLQALTALGRAGRDRSTARLIAITGSVGKTGTKEALRTCLSPQGETSANAASLNNHWGVPLSLARLPETARFGVFEIGMNHPGEIAALARHVRPHVAVITTIEAAHTEFFSSLADVADAKAEIFQGMEASGTAVLNRDNPFFPLLAEAAFEQGLKRILAFGCHGEAQVRMTGFVPGPAGSRITAMVEDREVEYWLGLPGKHWALNSLAVLAAVRAIGADVAQAAAALAELRALPGRGQQHRVRLAAGEFLLIDDSYNANPSSMKAAIEVLAEVPPQAGGRRIAVLGDMLELGPAAPELHARLAGPLIRAGVDQVHSCGPNMSALHEALPPGLRGAHAKRSQDLVPLVTAALGAGDRVLVKGSLGSRMALIVSALKDLGVEAPRVVNGGNLGG